MNYPKPLIYVVVTEMRVLIFESVVLKADVNTVGDIPCLIFDINDNI